MIMKDFKGCLILLGLSAGLAFGVNAISPSGIALFGQWDKSAGVLMAGSVHEDEVHAQEINNPLKVRRMIQEGKTVVLDVRRSDIFAQGHLPGALSFPLHAFDGIVGQLRDTVAKDDPVLVYCSGVACVDSHDFAARMIRMGYAQVMVYAGGFTEWQEMEFEVETNDG